MNSLCRVWCVLAALVALACASARGPKPLSRRDAVVYAGSPIDDGIPPSIVSRVIGDSGALQYYADMLDGRVKANRFCDTSIMLDYLGLSGQPRFVSTFLKFARPRVTIRERYVFWGPAVFGLTRLSDLPAAHDRLLVLGDSTVEPALRDMLVEILARWNSASAREILRQVSLAGVRSDTRTRVDSALSHEARP